MVNKRYPFKFLDAYQREDSDIFFGRSEEIDALYEMVFQTDLLLIYGASGTGKTSLIQCGLASKFQTHDWLALNIRRGNDLNDSLEKVLKDAEGTIEKENDDLNWLDKDFSDLEEVIKTPKKLSSLALSLKNIYLNYFKPIYLIFDQFEELYILGNKEEQVIFIDTIKEVLQVEQPVKVIISVREEYLGYLYEFEKEVPQLLRKKLRVEPMTLDKVKTVVNKVDQSPLSNIHLKKGEENAIAEAIFDKIRGEEKTLNIQLPYLQVFLDKLYLQTTGDESREQEAIFTLKGLESIGNIGDVLRDFLDEQVVKIAQQTKQVPADIWKVLSPFVTLEGTKEPLSEANLETRLPKLEKHLVGRILQAFVNSRILRFIESEQLYEIAHDSLAKQIHAKRSDEEIAILEVRRLVKSQTAMREEAREYFTERQLLFIEPFLGKFRRSAEEEAWIQASREEVKTQATLAEQEQRKQLEAAKKQATIEKLRAEEAERLRKEAETGRKRSIIFSIIAICVAMIAVGLGIWANQQKNKAQVATFRAQLTAVNELKVQGKYEQALAEIVIANNSSSDKNQVRDLAKQEKIITHLQQLRSEGAAFIVKENYLKGLLKYDSMHLVSPDAYINNLLRESREKRNLEVANLKLEAKKVIDFSGNYQSATEIYDEILENYVQTEDLIKIRDSLKNRIPQ